MVQVTTDWGVHGGITNSIDHLMTYGLDAIEISWRLEIPTYLVRERFAHQAAQYTNHDSRIVEQPDTRKATPCPQ